MMFGGVFFSFCCLCDGAEISDAVDDLSSSFLRSEILWVALDVSVASFSGWRLIPLVARVGGLPVLFPFV